MQHQDNANEKQVLKLVDVVKVFESQDVKTTALRGVTMEFEAGKSYFIQGPSG